MALGGCKKIKTAALVSGGAHKLIKEAALAQVDAFITGSFDEPSWPDAYENGVNFYALGHSATEKIGPRSLGKHLEGIFPIHVEFLDIPNPF